MVTDFYFNCLLITIGLYILMSTSPMIKNILDKEYNQSIITLKGKQGWIAVFWLLFWPLLLIKVVLKSTL